MFVRDFFTAFAAPFANSIERAPLALLLAVAVACSDSTTQPGPAPVATLHIAPPSATVYELDDVHFTATLRDANGNPVSGAPVVWSVSDSTRAELAGDGTITALKSGNVIVIARSGSVTATYTLSIVKLAVLNVQVLPGEITLARGEIRPVGVKVEGQGGRIVPGRLVSITSDDPAIVTIDPAGRARAVSPGVTMVRATADGVSGAARVVVTAENVTLILSRNGSARLPLLVASDSVTWNGVRELHEVYMESGQLELSGTMQPRYQIEVRYAEYRVINANGARALQLVTTSREYDRGVVAYDSRGDLMMTSDYISPLAHTASPENGGLRVRFRIPGSDEYLDLLYRREPN